MILHRWAGAVLALALTAAAPALASGGGASAASNYCDRSHLLNAGEQSRLLRFAAVVREELAATGDDRAVLVSRTGYDLSRFHIRYSHAAIAWPSENGAWSLRQLYYACDEKRPRIYDQGLAGFTLGMGNEPVGYIAIVKPPREAGQALRQATRDDRRAVGLLAARYSANAYAFGLRYQNCNQWTVEMMAAAWGDLPSGPGLRERAQDWLRTAGYAPEPVNVGSHWLMFLGGFVPMLNLEDHPEDERYTLQLRISLPATLETFVRQRYPESERVEICHDSRQAVVHRGWEPMADGCKPGPGDRVVSLE